MDKHTPVRTPQEKTYSAADSWGPGGEELPETSQAASPTRSAKTRHAYEKPTIEDLELEYHVVN